MCDSRTGGSPAIFLVLIFLSFPEHLSPLDGPEERFCDCSFIHSEGEKMLTVHRATMDEAVRDDYIIGRKDHDSARPHMAKTVVLRFGCGCSFGSI